MILLLPENFDIDEVNKEYPPTEFKNYSKEKALYLLSQVVKAKATHSHKMLPGDFTPLNSTVLQDMVHDYNLYMAYFIRTTSLEMYQDCKYIVSEQSKAYKFTEKYSNTIVKPFEINMPSIEHNENRIKKKNRMSLAQEKRIYHISKWTKELNFDVVGAENMNHSILEYKVEHPNEWDFDYRRDQKKNPWDQYNSAAYCIGELKNYSYNISVDGFGGRVYSTITSLNKNLRPCFTYGPGKLRIGGYDMKNGNPYLFLRVMQKSFWYPVPSHTTVSSHTAVEEQKDDEQLEIAKDTQLVDEGTVTGKVMDSALDRITIYDLFKGRELQSVLSKVLIPKGERGLGLDIPFMLEETPECSDMQSIKRSDVYDFRDDVLSGQLYENQEVEFNKHGIYFENRKQVKTEVLRIMFTSNRFLNQEYRTYYDKKKRKIKVVDARCKKIFSENLPDVYKIIEHLKSKDKKLLVRLLQRLESHLVLHVICKRISKQRPNMPLWTIHDCIYTTEGNQDYLKQVMEEEFTKAIGYKPALEADNWY